MASGCPPVRFVARMENMDKKAMGGQKDHEEGVQASLNWPPWILDPTLGPLSTALCGP